MQARAALGSALSNHMQVIWYNWIAILILVVCYVISSIAGAAGSESKAYGFLVIWNMLLLIAYAVGGTMIVRQPKYRSPLSVGFLIGVSLMNIFVMLETGVASGANFAGFGGGDMASSTEAVTAFSALLLIALTAFTTFLVMFRDTLLPPAPMSTTDQSEQPPSLPGGSFGGTVAGQQPGAYAGATAGGYGGSSDYDKGHGTLSGYDTSSMGHAVEHVSITPTIPGASGQTGVL